MLKKPSFACFPGIGATVILVGLSVHSLAMESVTHFPDTTLDGWEERSFVGYSSYELTTEAGIRVLKASTEGKASLLYREGTVELSETPLLNWWWKIDGVYDNRAEQTREGDDFPARIYVVARTGFLPWESLSLNYVWASSSNLGSSWVSPFTEKSVMVALQSGPALSGEWIYEERNVLQDFATYFGIEITQINGLAVMVDGDNSGHAGTAYFGGIEFTDY